MYESVKTGESTSPGPGGRCGIQKMKPKAKDILTAKARPDSSVPDILKPLEPVTKAYWLIHPQKALYLWLFQKSFGFAWNLAKRYFRE